MNLENSIQVKNVRNQMGNSLLTAKNESQQN